MDTRDMSYMKADTCQMMGMEIGRERGNGQGRLRPTEALNCAQLKGVLCT